MKKNKMMRLASAMMVMTLMTTSVISGTFAKYVTQDSVTDSARVAKFGVVVTAEGSLFEDTYINAPSDDDDALTVVKSDGSINVVAPGTNNGNNTFKFSITGQPEVDVRVEVVATSTNGDIFLKSATGTYPDMTTGDDDKFDLANDYHPVKYTLKKQGTDVVADVTLEKLIEALNGISTAKVDANQNLETLFGAYEISWVWAYYVDDTTDKADTLLGDLAVTPELIDTENYNLNTDLTVTIKVTQID